eukprot:scaffold71237_cov30-Tisochrysis_lutea.AAC.2
MSTPHRSAEAECNIKALARLPSSHIVCAHLYVAIARGPLWKKTGCSSISIAGSVDIPTARSAISARVVVGVLRISVIAERRALNSVFSDHGSVA